MTERKNELAEVLYTDKFAKDYLIQDDVNLLLNSITVFGVTNGINEEAALDPVGFTIRVVDGKRYVYPLEIADSYLLQAKRLVKATVLEIKAEDCYESYGVDGDFRFVLKESE